MSDPTPILLDLADGELYRFAGVRAANNTWAVPPGTYRLVGVFVDVHTLQERVAYVGVGGRDDDRGYVCGLEDWSRLFRRLHPPAPEVQAPAPEPVPEKVAGARREASER